MKKRNILFWHPLQLTDRRALSRLLTTTAVPGEGLGSDKGGGSISLNITGA